MRRATKRRCFHDASYDRLDVSSFSERFGDLLGGEQCLPVFPAAYHVPRGKGKGNDKRAFEKGVVTVHTDEEAVAKTKRKKIIRRKIIKKVAKKPAADEAPKAGDEKEKTASAEKTAEAGDSSGKAEG